VRPRGATASPDTTCKQRDSQWLKSVNHAYSKVTAATLRQQALIRRNGPAGARLKAQYDVYDALIDEGATARKTVPCSRGALKLRLALVHLGSLAAEAKASLQAYRVALQQHNDAMAQTVLKLYIAKARELARQADATNKIVLQLSSP
jgi:hypothetical protein